MKQALIALVVTMTAWFSQVVLSAEASTDPAAVPRMTIEQLKARLGAADIVIIDVRTAHDWNDSANKIQGAVREEATRLGTWINKYPKDKTLVLYCK